MDKAHEGGKRLFAAQGDAAETLEPVEEALDLVALLVELPVDGRLDGAARIGLDLRAGPEIIGDEGAQGSRIVGGIGDDVSDTLQAGQERFCLRAVAVLARGRVDADWQAERVDNRVQLGGQAAARAADGGSLSPPFAPVASAWTLEMVLSIRTYSKSGVSASAWNNRSHTPACDQRRNRA